MSIGRVMREVFGDENVQTVLFGNALSATAFIQGMSVEDLDDRTLLDVKDPEYAIMIGVIAKCVK